MPFNLPDDDALYRALLTRDAAYEGLAWVGVTSTGVFCRLTCPARKPKRQNTVFFDSVAACMDAGFRPCKRCRPLGSAAQTDPLVAGLVDALEQDPARRWTEDDIVQRGFDPSTVRRAFKRHFGITFLEMARLRRVRNGAAILSGGARVLDAQFEAGFESASGFRAALARILGRRPSGLKAGSGLRADWIETPLGAMIAVAGPDALHLLEFFERPGLPNELKRLQASSGAIGVGRYPATEQIEAELGDYFNGIAVDFHTPTAQAGSEFARNVWRALRKIPLGETRSYGEIAAIVGRPAACRAVARANGANQIAIVVPCHRVIGADGSLTGYGGGRWRKQRLIEHERAMAGTGPATRRQRSA
ncbi:MAG: trifunctional transcriptional activator/DNA repair protein Ada/methylated-DNA--[protein]-cysteine S-methyltransferase [Pseudomonadota bacterium]